ncbi:MAG: hypothetical protein CR975_01940 [Gammaproteobacteria bacterium]|nr:MAG: hypothetical protein CR975_01940 [Gammaproteobacteria bacterium]
MRKKLLLWFVAGFIIVPFMSFSAGLGSVRTYSHLNEPLRAEIPVLSLMQEGKISVALAPDAEFSKRGVTRTAELDDLRFSLIKRRGRYYIKVSSNKKVSTPYVNFVLQLDDLENKSYREYAVFLDPPASGGKAKQAPAVAQVQQKTGKSHIPLPKQRPVRRSTLPVKKGQFGKYGPVKRGETLSGVASRVRPNKKVSVAAMMALLKDANPRLNKYGLQAGSILKVPTIKGYSLYRGGHGDVAKTKEKAPIKNTGKQSGLTLTKAVNPVARTLPIKDANTPAASSTSRIITTIHQEGKAGDTTNPVASDWGEIDNSVSAVDEVDIKNQVKPAVSQVVASTAPAVAPQDNGNGSTSGWVEVDGNNAVFAETGPGGQTQVVVSKENTGVVAQEGGEEMAGGASAADMANQSVTKVITNLHKDVKSQEAGNAKKTEAATPTKGNVKAVADIKDIPEPLLAAQTPKSEKNGTVKTAAAVGHTKEKPAKPTNNLSAGQWFAGGAAVLALITLLLLRKKRQKAAQKIVLLGEGAAEQATAAADTEKPADDALPAATQKDEAEVEESIVTDKDHSQQEDNSLRQEDLVQPERVSAVTTVADKPANEEPEDFVTLFSKHYKEWLPEDDDAFDDVLVEDEAETVTADDQPADDQVKALFTLAAAKDKTVPDETLVSNKDDSSDKGVMFEMNKEAGQTAADKAGTASAGDDSQNPRVSIGKPKPFAVDQVKKGNRLDLSGFSGLTLNVGKAKKTPSAQPIKEVQEAQVARVARPGESVQQPKVPAKKIVKDIKVTAVPDKKPAQVIDNQAKPPISDTPAVATAAPTVSTAAPTAATAAPTIATADLTVATADPTVATADPTVATADLTVATADPTVATAAPTIATADPTAATAASTAATVANDKDASADTVKTPEDKHSVVTKETESEMELKLAVAKALISIANYPRARKLLEYIVQKGSAEQIKKARAMLETM